MDRSNDKATLRPSPRAGPVALHLCRKKRKFSIASQKTKIMPTLPPRMVVLPFLLCANLLFSQIPSFPASPDSIALQSVADSLYAAKDYETAAMTLQPLADHYRKKKDWAAYLRMTMECVRMRQRSGRPGERKKAADTLAGAAREAGSRISPSTPELWAAYHKAGVAYHLAGAYPEAIAHYQKALDGRRAYLKPTDAEQLQGNLNIALAYYKMGQYQAVIEYGNRALDFRQGAEEEKINELYQTIARAYRETGDIQQALVYYGVVFPYKKNLGKESPWVLAEFLNDLAILQAKIGRPDSSLRFATWSRDLILGMDERYEEDTVTLAIALYNMGDACVGLGRFDAAFEHYRHARELYAYLYGDHSLEVAHVLNNMGLAYSRKEDWDRAESLLLEALSIKESEPFLQEEQSSTLENLGDVYLARGEPEKALRSYHRSLICHLPSFDDPDPGADPSREESELAATEVTILLLAAKARSWMAIYHRDQDVASLQAAHRAYRQSLEGVDALRLSYQADDSKTFLVEKTRPLYEAAIEACLQLQEHFPEAQYQEEAFHYVERSKSIILLDAVRKSRAGSFAGVDPAWLQKERKIRWELGWLARQIAENRAEGNLEEESRLTATRLARQITYDSLLQDMRGRNPAYFSLMHEVRTVGPGQVREELLGEGQALLNYFVGSENIYLFCLRPSGLEVEKIPHQGQIQKRVEELRSAIHRPFTEGAALSVAQKKAYDSAYARQAFALFQMLLAPLEESLPEELIIIPDGVLGYLPFEALLTEASPPGDYMCFPYLLRRHELSYAYSATLLLEMKRKPARGEHPSWLGFAPAFSASDAGGLGPLFFNREEVSRLGRKTGGRGLYGAQASKDRFLDLAPSYSVLHLSSHGRAHDSAPNDSSYIAFSGGKGTQDVQLMYAWELYNLPLEADMVVLSVCETGLGKLQQGEGIISLSRAFAYAGAKSVVTTLWKVNDQASSDLMVAYYDLLEKGLPKDQALASAKRGLLENPSTARPYYWAGFIATGDMSPIYGQGKYYLAGLLVLIGLLVGWLGWSRRRILLYQD